MLVRFTVSNFMSFKEETEFNMFPASGQKRLKEHIYSAGGIEVLKMGAIYGANGAGKSNLVKAMAAMRNIVMSQNFNGIEKYRLDESYVTKPSTFEIEFLDSNHIYSYRIAVDRGIIVEEWLYETDSEKEKLIFKRTTKEQKTQIEMPDYSISDEDKLRIKLYENDLLKDNTTLLQMISQSKEPFRIIKKAFDYIIHGLYVLDRRFVFTNVSVMIYGEEGLRSFVNENIASINSGITKIDFDTVGIETYFGKEQIALVEGIKTKVLQEGYVALDEKSSFSPFAVRENQQVVVKTMVSLHKNSYGKDVRFNPKAESDGTQMLFVLIPWVYIAITLGFTLIIDEIEQSIHVNLLKELISKFSKDKNTKGQLIFTTHESNLLDQDILRQDEIWFAEKNPAGETGFYPLSDYDIRSDLDIRKGYLNGRFGAIPFLANLHDLNWDKYAKEEV